MFDAINGALAQAMPERAMGAFSHWSNPNIGGIDDRTGKPFVLYDLGLAGYGGRHDRDGPEALSPVMNCANIPVEVHEALNPVRVRRLAFIPDSSGPGRHRGGSGLRKDIELLNSRATLSLLGDRHVFEPYGVFGGGPGRRAETVLNPGRNERALASKGHLEIERGDVVSFRLSGAGGYGPPAERAPDAIAGDLADGYITPEFAREVYGYEA
jgi:N-methylhydantoinase B